MSEQRILLVRHPETVANVEHRYVGRGDTAFTERGERQAAALVEAVSAWKPNAVWSSPRPRAFTVAAAIAEAYGLEAIVDPGLAEIDFGQAEGFTYDEAAARGVAPRYAAIVPREAALSDELGGPARQTATGGEAWEAFSARVRNAGERITSSGSSRIAVVTHGGVVRSMLVGMLGLRAEDAWRFEIAPATMAEIVVREGFGSLAGLRPVG